MNPLESTSASVSPAWHAWVGQAASLDVVSEIGIDRIHSHDIALADRFCRAVGVPRSDSAIVSLDADPGVARAVGAAGVVASTPGGRLRFAFHLHNTDSDVDRAAHAVLDAGAR